MERRRALKKRKGNGREGRGREIYGVGLFFWRKEGFYYVTGDTGTKDEPDKKA